MRKKLLVLTALIGASLALGFANFSRASAATASVATFTQLQSAVAAAASGDTIQLTANIDATAQIRVPDGINLTINGSGFTVSRDPSLTTYIFATVNSNVSYENLTIDGENVASTQHCLIANPTSGQYSVSLNNVTVENCTSSANGAGVYIASSANISSVNITNSKFQNNSATTVKNGGALYISAANSTISGSIFTNNTATSSGGAIEYAGGGNNVITGSKFSENTASGSTASLKSSGGALVVFSEPTATKLAISNSSFANNKADGDGGAIVAVLSTDSGATFSEPNATNITVDSSTTFSGNIAGNGSRQIATSDVATYNSLVSATKFSNSYQYGWNNDDIAYTGGTSGAQPAPTPVNPSPVKPSAPGAPSTGDANFSKFALISGLIIIITGATLAFAKITKSTVRSQK